MFLFVEVKMKDRTCVIIVIVLIIGILVYGASYKEEVIKEEIIHTYPCENLSLYDTSYCLRDFVAIFYNYTEREDTIKTAKDIIENGGDCYDYSLLYQFMFEILGFNTSIELFFFGEDENNMYGHQYLRVEATTGYCSVDQLDVHCFIFE